MSKLISKIVVPDSNEATGYSLYNVKDSGAIHSSDVGVAGGVASLDSAGKVPSSQLPSYVDDVVEGYYHENKFYTTYTPGQEEEDPGTYSGEITAETGKIYVDIPTNQSYRWSGSAYIVISSPLQDGKFIVIKDLNTAPTESTLTYTENGTVKNFKQGDEVRVPDAEADNGYTFYKLYELTTSGNTTTATWDKLGAGGAPVNPNETVNISLTQIGGDSADLIGTAITITDDGSGNVILSTTWQGSAISAEIGVNIDYTVSVGTIAGYLVCANQSYRADYHYERNISFQYIALGAYVEATDGTLYTSSTWPSSGKTANSVVLITSTIKFRISLVETIKGIHSTDIDPDVFSSFYPTIYTKEQALNDFEGDIHTLYIRNANRSVGTDTTAYAAPYCNSIILTLNSQICYLPSYAQAVLMRDNKASIDACMNVCGGTTIMGASGSPRTQALLTSTRGSNHPNAPWSRLWFVHKDGSSSDEPIYLNAALYTRPVADYE